MKNAEFRFVDLCAGIGGLRIPFETRRKGRFIWGKYRLPGECVWVSELDPDARMVYSQNFKPDDLEAEDYEATINRDFTSIDPHQVPDHELLLAGFPCQPFSHAGKRLGKADERGRVFDAIERIIQAKRPQVVLLENVKGLTTLRNPDGSLVLNEILSALKNPRGLKHPGDKISKDPLEYVVPQPKVLNARDFGLPQNRQRLFIVAIRKDVAERIGMQSPGGFSFPEPTVDRNSLRLGDFLHDSPPKEFTISPKLWKGHKERKERNRKAGKGFGYQDFDPDSRYVATISSRYFKDGSEALIHQPKKTNSSVPRKLMPEEAARLQGFPKNFYLHPSKMKSFRQLGNAVPIPVVDEIARVLHESGALKPEG